MWLTHFYIKQLKKKTNKLVKKKFLFPKTKIKLISIKKKNVKSYFSK